MRQISKSLSDRPIAWPTTNEPVKHTRIIVTHYGGPDAFRSSKKILPIRRTIK